MLKFHCLNGAVPFISANKDGSFSVRITPSDESVRTLENKIMTVLTHKKAMPFLEIAGDTGSGIEN